MCGIVGYIGEQDVKDILLNGLEKLELYIARKNWFLQELVELCCFL